MDKGRKIYKPRTIFDYNASVHARLMKYCDKFVQYKANVPKNVMKILSQTEKVEDFEASKSEQLNEVSALVRGRSVVIQIWGTTSMGGIDGAEMLVLVDHDLVISKESWKSFEDLSSVAIAMCIVKHLDYLDNRQEISDLKGKLKKADNIGMGDDLLILRFWK